jgi:outer membrane protein TolC
MLIPVIGHSGEVLDLKRSLQKALDKSPQYQSQILTETNAALSEKNSWMTQFPTFDLQASHSFFQHSRGDQQLNPLGPQHAPWSDQLGLAVNLNVYDNGDSWRQAQIASLTHKIETLRLSNERSRLLTNVAKAYYDFSIAHESVELQKSQIEALRIQFRSIQGRYQQGLSSNRDFLRIKALLQSSEIGLLSQQINLSNSQSALRLLINESVDVEFLPIDVSKIDITKIEFPLATIDQSIEYQITHLQTQVSGLTFETIHRLKWPRVTAKASSNYLIPQYIGPKSSGLDDPFWNLQAMIVLDYRIWDWGKNVRTVQIANNQKSIEENSRQITLAQITHSLDELHNQAKILQHSAQMSSDILKANADVYQSLNRGYFDGKVSYLELITALNDLYSSRTQDLGLRFNILKLRAELAHAQGNIDEALSLQ